MEDRVKKLTDLKKLTLQNQKLSEETLTLASKNQTSLEINAELWLEKLLAENQKLREELIALTKRTNASLAMQSELYEKAIEATKLKEAINFSRQSIDTRRYPLDESEIGFRN